jgi:DNA uptake protein ComE-like DNA-binding protein
VPTSNERKALWFLAFVAMSGSGVRLWRAGSPVVPAADSVSLARQLARVDSSRAQRGAREPPRSMVPPISGENRPAAPGASPESPIDLDRAGVTEIDGLPGIGPALAARIVANRDSLGAFGHLEAVCQVRGVGPGLVERLRPLVTFSGPHRPVSDECGDASKKPRKSRAPRGRKQR